MSMPGLLSDAELESVTREMARNAALHTDSTVRGEALTALTFVSVTYPQLMDRQVYDLMTTFIRPITEGGMYCYFRWGFVVVFCFCVINAMRKVNTCICIVRVISVLFTHTKYRTFYTLCFYAFYTYSCHSLFSFVYILATFIVRLQRRNLVI